MPLKEQGIRLVASILRDNGVILRSALLKAAKLAELRSIEHGEPERFTVARIAREAGLDRGTVQTLIDSPERTTLGTAAKIARVLGCGISDLVEVVEYESSNY